MGTAVYPVAPSDFSGGRAGSGGNADLAPGNDLGQIKGDQMPAGGRVCLLPGCLVCRRFVGRAFSRCIDPGAYLPGCLFPGAGSQGCLVGTDFGRIYFSDCFVYDEGVLALHILVGVSFDSGDWVDRVCGG